MDVEIATLDSAVRFHLLSFFGENVRSLGLMKCLSVFSHS